MQKDARRSPCLRFTANTWAKLKYFCHRGETEIGAFGVTPLDDLLLVEALCVPEQHATAVTVGFEDEAVADFFEDQVAAGLGPEQFGRIWIHTHPGDSPAPSTVDEATFARVFGGCDWAVMFILARGGATYTRLRFNTGPGGEMTIPVEVDFHQPFDGSDHAAWDAEYRACVHAQPHDPFMAGAWESDLVSDPAAWIDEPDCDDAFEADLLLLGEQ